MLDVHANSLILSDDLVCSRCEASRHDFCHGFERGRQKTRLSGLMRVDGLTRG
jgi:hypothetical protein